MRRVYVVEGQPVEGLSAPEEGLVRRRIFQLQAEMRPHIPFLANGATLRLQNIVGSVQVEDGFVLDIHPKTLPGGSWSTAIVDLVTPKSKASLGKYDSGSSVIETRELPDAFASSYASRLEYGLRRDGPLSGHVRAHVTSPRLSGRLDVSAWLKGRVLSPGTFPQERSYISFDNRYSNVLAWVAELLARRTGDSSVSAKLRSLAAAIRPGVARVTGPVDSTVVASALPDQWRAYGDAWDLARAVIRRSSPLTRESRGSGFGLAIEPWPLLEELSSRVSDSLALSYAQNGPAGFEGGGHSGKYLARVANRTASAPGSVLPGDGYVDPDALLKYRGTPVVTFEAKYTSFTQSNVRKHSFQALSTGAVLEVPVSVLIYPGSFGPVVWDMQGFYGGLRSLIAFGVDMYGYREGGEFDLASQLRAAIDAAGCSPLDGMAASRGFAQH